MFKPLFCRLKVSHRHFSNNVPLPTKVGTTIFFATATCRGSHVDFGVPRQEIITERSQNITSGHTSGYVSNRRFANRQFLQLSDERCWHVCERSPSKCCKLPVGEALYVVGTLATRAVTSGWRALTDVPTSLVIQSRKVPVSKPLVGDSLNSTVSTPKWSKMDLFRHLVNGVGRGGGQTVFNRINVRLKPG